MAFLDDLAKYQAAEAAKYQTGFQDYLMQGQPSAPTFDQGDSFSQYLIDMNSFVPRDVGQVGLDKGLQSYQSLFAGFPLNDAQKAAVAQNNAQKISPYMQSLGFNNPVDWFASVGDNRNALYGAYGAATPNPQTSTDSEGNTVSNPYSWEMDLGFGNRQAMPNLQAYSGQQLVFDDWFENKYAGQSSQEAQQILKQFFPNIPQSQLDQAAYSAIQKQGYMPYWGAGPIPTVRLIADELGVANPSLSAWMDANQDAYSKRYQSYRDQVHSAEDADSMSQNMASISGLASVFGPAIGGMMGYGPFGGAGSAGSTAGGSSMFGDLFNGVGDWFSNLFDSGGGSPTWGSPEWMAAQDFANFGVEGVNALGNSLGYSQGLDWTSPLLSESAIQNMVDMTPGMADKVAQYIRQNPGSTIKTAMQALGGSGGSGGSLLGTALGGLLGSYNGAKQAGTTTTTQVPWAAQQPYLLDAFKKAQQASNGSPIQTQANTNYKGILDGTLKNPYLGQDNPYLQKQIDYANEDVTRAMMPAMNQANRGSGSFGNSGVAETFGRAMTDQYGRNANTMRMQDYTQQQNLAESDINRKASFTQNANNFVAQPSQNYAQTIQGNYGGSTTTPYFNNPASNILGGAMLGNKIGSLWG